MSTTNPPDNMTGAELQTLREACGMSREELGRLAGVQARTVKHWENGRAGVPADVAELVERIEGIVIQAAGQADAMRNQAEHLAAINGEPFDLVLMRYRDEDLQRYHPEMKGLPASVHGAIVGQVRAAAQADGVPVRVVWMVSGDYEAWRAELGHADNEATRAAWAAGQVQAQALPHRADQPPA